MFTFCKIKFEVFTAMYFLSMRCVIHWNEQLVCCCFTSVKFIEMAHFVMFTKITYIEIVPGAYHFHIDTQGLHKPTAYMYMNNFFILSILISS